MSEWLFLALCVSISVNAVLLALWRRERHRRQAAERLLRTPLGAVAIKSRFQ